MDVSFLAFSTLLTFLRSLFISLSFIFLVIKATLCNYLHNHSEPASCNPESIPFLDERLHIFVAEDNMEASHPELYVTCNVYGQIQGLSLSVKDKEVYAHMDLAMDPDYACVIFVISTYAILQTTCVGLASTTATEWWVCSFAVREIQLAQLHCPHSEKKRSRIRERRY